MTTRASRIPRTVPFALALLLTLTACGGGGGGDVLPARASLEALDQAVYTGSRYEHAALGSIPTLSVIGAPDDADGSRWAMLHDGSRHRLYCMRLGDDATLYQFGYDASAGGYVYGYDSIPQIGIAGVPPGADRSSFAMLHDGSDYRLYMRDRADPAKLHQFAFNPASGDYEYGFRSIAVITTAGLPADADTDRWAMLHDGTTYRQYVAKAGSRTTLYQFGFDGSRYLLGYRSIPEIDVVGMPASSDAATFAMLHDGSYYHFYNPSR